MLSIRPISQGLIVDQHDNMYPSMLFGHVEGRSEFSEKSSHYFAFVVEGEARISHDQGAGSVTLKAGMYVSCPGPLEITGTACVAIFQRIGYRGLIQWGGPTEDHGRLCYIDNCRSTLLVPPARVGDPCLNLLTFPAGTKQTMHIHPTLRLGVVHRGSAQCVSRDGSRTPLKAGDAFYLPEATPHCFHTEGDALTVIAYHPDTDVGPNDSSHPMLNRTYTKI